MRYGIDIFSGAGRLSLGAEMAGIRISTAIEINPHAAKTFLRNHKGAKVLQGDIQETAPQALQSNKKSLFVIMGGPPCQGFSLSEETWKNVCHAVIGLTPMGTYDYPNRMWITLYQGYDYYKRLWLMSFERHDNSKAIW